MNPSTFKQYKKKKKIANEEAKYSSLKSSANHEGSRRFFLSGSHIYTTPQQVHPYYSASFSSPSKSWEADQCTGPSTWLTNQCTDPSTWLTHQLEENVGCKVLQFIQMMKIKKLLGYKTLSTKTQQLLQRLWWTRAILFPVTICVQQQLQQPLYSL